MLLSFVLFIAAILFIFLYINPLSKTQNKVNEIDQVQKIIMENISVTAGRLSVVSYFHPVNNPNGCYYFETAEYYNVKYVQFDESSPGTNKKYTIYFSDNFPISNAINKSTTSADCLGANYGLGVYSNETIILYDLLESFAASSSTDEGYKKIKEDLGINTDFIINCADINGTYLPELSASRRIPAGVEVRSKQFPIRLIENNGTIMNVIFNLRVS